MDDQSLTLDVTTTGREGPAARIAVTSTTGLTREGSETISVDCRTTLAFEAEVERIKAELDACLVALREAWGEAGAPAPPAADAGQAVAPRQHATLEADLHVADVMTRDVQTVGRNDQLSVADDLMKAGRFRHVVVVDQEGRLEGVVSQRDLFYGALAWSMGQGSQAHRRTLEALPVKQVMKTDPVQVEPATPLRTAASMMIEHKVGCLPVVERERVVGILTEGDFLALIA